MGQTERILVSAAVTIRVIPAVSAAPEIRVA
jgi:hypothetical protein